MGLTMAIQNSRTLAQKFATKNPHGKTETGATAYSWVMTQRKFKRALDRGEPSQGMTVVRLAKLDVLGFAWVRRG
jgi:hypothetical protein